MKWLKYNIVEIVMLPNQTKKVSIKYRKNWKGEEIEKVSCFFFYSTFSLSMIFPRTLLGLKKGERN